MGARTQAHTHACDVQVHAAQNPTQGGKGGVLRKQRCLLLSIRLGLLHLIGLVLACTCLFVWLCVSVVFFQGDTLIHVLGGREQAAVQQNIVCDAVSRVHLCSHACMCACVCIDMLCVCVRVCVWVGANIRSSLCTYAHTHPFTPSPPRARTQIRARGGADL